MTNSKLFHFCMYNNETWQIASHEKEEIVNEHSNFPEKNVFFDMERDAIHKRIDFRNLIWLLIF